MTSRRTLSVPVGKAPLLGISKRGNTYLRKILVHGARAAVLGIKRERAPIGAWMEALESCQPSYSARLTELKYGIHLGRTRVALAICSRMSSTGGHCKSCGAHQTGVLPNPGAYDWHALEGVHAAAIQIRVPVFSSITVTGSLALCAQVQDQRPTLH